MLYMSGSRKRIAAVWRRVCTETCLLRGPGNWMQLLVAGPGAPRPGIDLLGVGVDVDDHPPGLPAVTRTSRPRRRPDSLDATSRSARWAGIANRAFQREPIDALHRVQNVITDRECHEARHHPASPCYRVRRAVARRCCVRPSTRQPWQPERHWSTEPGCRIPALGAARLQERWVRPCENGLRQP